MRPDRVPANLCEVFLKACPDYGDRPIITGPSQVLTYVHIGREDGLLVRRGSTHRLEFFAD